MIHETAIIEPHAFVSDTSEVWANTHVMRDAKVGSFSRLGEGVHVGPRVEIGMRCKVQNGAQIFEGVRIEDDVFIGPHVVFTNVTTPRAFISRRAQCEPTLVKRGASIGANATIVCGVTIGEFALVGAGSVVTANVSDYGCVVGVPARCTGFVCRCGRKFSSTAFSLSDPRCSGCGLRYVFSEFPMRLTCLDEELVGSGA